MLPPLDWTELGRALAGPPPDLDKLAEPWCVPNGRGFWLSRSAWSLRVVAEWRARLKPDGVVRIWLPELFCDQSTGGLRELGAIVVFYPLTDELAPDWGACSDRARSDRPDVFVLVHFLGCAGPAREAAEFSRRHGAVFVEDCAHCLLPGAGVGRTGDFALYSPHKLLALPDGALLVALPPAARHTGGDAVELERSLRAVIDALPVRTRSAAKWVAGRFLARMIPGPIARWRRRRTALRRLHGHGDKGLPWSPAPTALSLRLLARYQPHLEADGEQRLQNAAQLKEQLGSVCSARFLAPLPGQGIPYLLGARLKTEEETRAFCARLRSAGVPATHWPDMPPEVLQQPERHARVLQFWHTTVYLPVHQRLSAGRWLAAVGAPAQPKMTGDAIEIDWTPSAPEWAECYGKAPRSSLLQARFYARAKQRTGRWRAAFALLRRAGRPVGTVAALRWGGLTRINRGPCWAEMEVDRDTQWAALAALRRSAGWWRGCLISIAPNVALHDEALADLAAIGYRRRRTRAWHSAWMDLRRPEAELMAALDGKWRNQLNTARRAGVQVEIARSAEAVEWIVARHEEMKAQRGIEGPAAELLRCLREEANGVDEDLVVLRAGTPGAAVAGILLARHGTSSTYLVGWNSDEGRRQNAGNVLLWAGLQEMRRIGCEWLDLCGIDERRSRGIAAFKRGFGGEEYRLAGEYWVG